MNGRRVNRPGYKQPKLRAISARQLASVTLGNGGKRNSCVVDVWGSEDGRRLEITFNREYGSKREPKNFPAKVHLNWEAALSLAREIIGSTLPSEVGKELE